MYFDKITKVNGINVRRRKKKYRDESLVKKEFNQTGNIIIGGIKDTDCNTKNNLLNIEFPISGLGERKI